MKSEYHIFIKVLVQVVQNNSSFIHSSTFELVQFDFALMIDFKDLDFNLFWCDNDYFMSLLFRIKQN